MVEEDPDDPVATRLDEQGFLELLQETISDQECRLSKSHDYTVQEFDKGLKNRRGDATDLEIRAYLWLQSLLLKSGVCKDRSAVARWILDLFAKADYLPVDHADFSSGTSAQENLRQKLIGWER